jgi:DNA-binding MarR family transcriptional regulator
MFFLKELPTRQMLETYHKRFPQMNVESVDAALHLLRRASLLMRKLDTYFVNKNLSQLRFLILIVLDRESSRDGLMASEVAARLDVSRPVTTRTLQTLKDDGLLEFASHGEDARAKLVTLTSKGRLKLRNVLPGYYKVIEEFMEAKRGEA